MTQMMNNMFSSPQKQLIQLNDAWLEMSSKHESQILKSESCKPGLQISTNLVQSGENKFERIISIQIFNQVLQITDSFSGIKNFICDNRNLQKNLKQEFEDDKEVTALNQETLTVYNSSSSESMEEEGEEVIEENNSNSVETVSPKINQNKKQANKIELKKIRMYKRDRKNLVKNFVKAFRAFVNCIVDDDLIKNIKTLESDSELLGFRIKFERWIQSKNFNNQLIVDIIMHEDYSDLFVHFLEERAKIWIETSKIKDKESHLRAIEEYTKASKEDRGLANVRVLKFRKISKRISSKLE